VFIKSANPQEKKSKQFNEVSLNYFNRRIYSIIKSYINRAFGFRIEIQDDAKEMR
jgi:hypothetical protein